MAFENLNISFITFGLFSLLVSVPLFFSLSSSKFYPNHLFKGHNSTTFTNFPYFGEFHLVKPISSPPTANCNSAMRLI